MRDLIRISFIALIGGLIQFVLERFSSFEGFSGSPETLIRIFLIHEFYILSLVYVNYFYLNIGILNYLGIQNP